MGGRRDIREARLHLIHERSSRAGTVVLTGWPRRDHDLMSVELPSNVYIIVASNCLEVPVVFLVQHAQGSLRLIGRTATQTIVYSSKSSTLLIVLE
jgi:hypothetical protein